MLIVLCGKLGEHGQGLLVVGPAVELGREFLDASVLEQADGIGAHRAGALQLVRGLAVLGEPILATFERVGG